MFSGAGIANSISNNKTAIDNYKNLVENKLSNDALIKTVKELVATTISSTLMNSKTSITDIINVSNEIFIKGGNKCKTGGIFRIVSVSQDITIDSTTEVKKQISIIGDITSTVNTNVNENINNITKDAKDETVKKKVGSTFEKVASAVLTPLTDAMDDVADILSGSGACAGIKNTCETNQVTENDTKIQKKYGLDNKFNVSDAINSSNTGSSEITSSDITEIINSITGDNKIGVAGVCPKKVDISNIDQSISISALTQNETVNKLASKIATNYINKIEGIIKNMKDHKVKDVSNTSTGDIADLGDAAAAIIASGGDAMAKTINAGGKAVTDVLEAVDRAAPSAIDNIGKGLKDLVSGGILVTFGIPAIIIIVIIVIVYIIFTKVGGAVGSVAGGITNTVANIGTSEVPASFKYLFKSI